MVKGSAISEGALARLKAWCLSNRVELTYLYGSRARGSSRPDSDWDFALRFEGGSVSRCDRERLVCEAQEEMASSLGIPEERVDVHDFDAMPLALQYRVLRDGVRLHESRAHAHSELYVRVVAEYLDWRYYEERDLAALRRRIKEGRFGDRSGVR